MSCSVPPGPFLHDPLQHTELRDMIAFSKPAKGVDLMTDISTPLFQDPASRSVKKSEQLGAVLVRSL
jgi:hypothetical protein